MNPMGAQSMITVLTGAALHGRKTAATMTAHTKIMIHVKIDRLLLYIIDYATFLATEIVTMPQPAATLRGCNCLILMIMYNIIMLVG